MSSLPQNWKQTLRTCNFFMARREITYVFRVANQQAAAEGKEVYWKKEIADGWTLFSENPCYETAIHYLAVAPEMFDYFLGCCPGGALHRIALRTVANFSIGDYSLETNGADIQGLSELSSQEYAFFPRQFKGEVIYNTAPVEFLGCKWQFMVSLVEGKIIKWAASLELGKDDDIEEIGNNVFQYCEQFLGSPTQETYGSSFWDTSDGNVILQLSQVKNLFDISIFATSRVVRELKKL